MTKATSSELGIHPLAAIFPMMHGQDFDDFKGDIEVNGLHEPIVVHEDQVLDGRNRLRACRELGIDPTFVDWDGKGSILSFILSRNVQRRHMTEGQRVVTAARLAKLSRGRPAKKAQIQAITQETAADLFKVSRATVQAARQVLDRGVPELVLAVEQDEVSVSAAALVATLDREEQANLVGQGAKAITSRAAQVRQAAAEPKANHQLPIAQVNEAPSATKPANQDEAEPESTRVVREVDGNVADTAARPRRQAGVQRPPAKPESPEDCPIRADLPELNRARFDRMVDFYGRLQPVLDEFRRDHPDIDGEILALCREGEVPRSLLGLALTTKHPRHGTVCTTCGGSSHGFSEEFLCIDCLGDGFLLAQYGPYDLPPGSEAEAEPAIAVQDDEGTGT